MGRVLAAFWIWGLSVFWVQGCGIKTAPVAPRPDPLPAVADLRLTLGPAGIWLSWSLPQAPPADPEALSAFMVYRARSDASPEACKDCPVRFERLYRMPVEIRDAAGEKAPAFAFEDRPQRGFTYVYKVTLVDREGREGPDSNPVETTF